MGSCFMDEACSLFFCLDKWEIFASSGYIFSTETKWNHCLIKCGLMHPIIPSFLSGSSSTFSYRKKEGKKEEQMSGKQRIFIRFQNSGCHLFWQQAIFSLIELLFYKKCIFFPVSWHLYNLIILYRVASRRQCRILITPFYYNILVTFNDEDKKNTLID